MRQVLPIDPFLESIVSSVKGHLNIVLTASPGAGKTTRLPSELLKSVKGKILVLQPRRLAAISAAYRVAEEQNWKLGEEVGYQVRFDSKVSLQTRLIFLTDALLLRQLVRNQELSGVDLVVIDEFHERNIHQDLILGYLKEMQELGRDIKIMLMSATIELQKFKNFFSDLYTIDIPGRAFPLQIDYFNQSTRAAIDFDFFSRVSDAVKDALQKNTGDILVFLPGVGEINRVRQRLLEQGIDGQIDVLHGSLPLSDQRAVLQKSERRRVILTTNVAEASVTVDGVDYVIDAGLAKVMKVNPRTGFSQLEVGRISLFNATQRAGRAARQKSGTCVRLWSQYEETTMAVEPLPEVKRVDLVSSFLILSYFGISNYLKFSWLDDPSLQLAELATRTLRNLGAIDSEKRITDYGNRLIQYPLHPRLAALVESGTQRDQKNIAVFMAATLSEGGLRSQETVTTNLECDLTYRLESLLETKNKGSQNTVFSLVRQLGGEVPKHIDKDVVQRLLLRSFADRLCRRRDRSTRALMVGGRGVKLDQSSQVKSSEFFLALDGVDGFGQADTVVSVACGIKKDILFELLGEEIKIFEEVFFDDSKGKFYLSKSRALFDLPIDEPQLYPADATLVAEQLPNVIFNKWDWIVQNQPSLKIWVNRWKFFVSHCAEMESTFGEDVKREISQMAALGSHDMNSVLGKDFVGLIETVLGRDIMARLDDLVPEQFLAPSGFKHEIDYSEGHSAFVDIRLQELFGLEATPRILSGKIPITFRLLGPNYRPVQVTSDLMSFWRSGYIEVRKDLRTRYPKHSWPENPLTAKPEAKGRRR